MLSRQQRRALERERAKSHWQEPTPQHAIQKAAQALRKGIRLVRSLPWWADILTVLSAVYLVYQAFYAMVPEIRPDDVLSSSWTDLPFTAKNGGGIFAMEDTQFFCEVENVTWNGGGTTMLRVVGKLIHPVAQGPREIPTNATITFPCDVAANFQAFGVKADTSKTPLPILLIHMRIRTTYKIDLGLLDWNREAISPIFTWRAVSGGYQWLEGDTSDNPKF